MIHRKFRNVRIVPVLAATGKPILMIGNHFSWWDGFFACYLNQEIFHKKLHIMMLEEQLRPRMFLNKAGAYSIRKGSRDALESLKYTAGLMNDPGNLAVLYPQGEFESVYTFPVRFENGMEKIAGFAQNEFELVFYAALIDYFSYRKPTLTIYLEQANPADAGSARLLESAYNSFLAFCISKQRPE